KITRLGQLHSASLADVTRTRGRCSSAWTRRSRSSGCRWEPGELPRADPCRKAPMATDTTPTIRERREAIVREHVEAENRHDGEATIATFDHPRYEIIATGEIFDGAAEVQSSYDENYGAFPDFTVTIEHTPGSTGPRNSCCFSSSEVILYQVSQMVSHRRAGSDPEGVVPRDAAQGEQRFRGRERVRL